MKLKPSTWVGLTIIFFQFLIGLLMIIKWMLCVFGEYICIPTDFYNEFVEDGFIFVGVTLCVTSIFFPCFILYKKIREDYDYEY